MIQKSSALIKSELLILPSRATIRPMSVLHIVLAILKASIILIEGYNLFGYVQIYSTLDISFLLGTQILAATKLMFTYSTGFLLFQNFSTFDETARVVSKIYCLLSQY